MFCPYCGNDVLKKDNFCSNCGKSLKSVQNNNEENIENDFHIKKRVLFSSFMLFILIAAFCIYAYLAKVASTIDLDDSDIPEIMPKAENCNSPFVESEVLSIFKENDYYFKYISLKSIDEIRLQSPETVFSDKDNSNYVCSGIIELKSDLKGFKPANYEDDNIFYNFVYIDEFSPKIKKYTIYNLPVVYTSQMIDGKNYIEINETGNGKFDCIGVCNPVYKTEKKLEPIIKNETASEQEIQNINNINIDEKNKPKIKKDKTDKKYRRFRIFGRKKKLNSGEIE